MKRALIISILASVTLVACAQTDFGTLSVAGTGSQTDQRTIVIGGSTYRMTTAVLQEPIYDTLGLHLTRLEALEAAGGGSGLWKNTTGTFLEPLTAGHDVWMNFGENIYFDDTDAHIDPAFGQIEFYTQGTQIMRLANAEIYYYGALLPNATNTYSFGSFDKAWKELWSFGNHMRERSAPATPASGEGITWMNSVDGKLYFSTNTATYDLTGAGGGGDTGDSIIRMWEAIFEDTIGVRLDPVTWVMSDSGQMETGRKHGVHFYPGPASIHVSSTLASSDQTGDFSYNIHWATTRNGTPTNMYSSAQVVTGGTEITTGVSDTPDNADIPKEVFIWFTFSNVDDRPEDGVTIQGLGTYFNP